MGRADVPGLALAHGASGSAVDRQESEAAIAVPDLIGECRRAERCRSTLTGEACEAPGQDVHPGVDARRLVAHLEQRETRFLPETDELRVGPPRRMVG